MEKLGGDLWWAAVGTSPEVVVISSSLLAELEQAPLMLQDKSLVD